MDGVSNDVGGRIENDWAGGGKGEPPDCVLNILRKEGTNGIVISGVISWILVNRNESAKTIWKNVAVGHWKEEEVSIAKEALREAGGFELGKKVPGMKVNRNSGFGKVEKELQDIAKAIDYLTENKKMPLVLATANQIQRCPRTLGSVEQNASMGELASKIASLESCLTKYIEGNNLKLK